MTTNMKFDFHQQNMDEIEPLEDFKLRLAKQMMLNAFFQNERKQDFDMLRYKIFSNLAQLSPSLY